MQGLKDFTWLLPTAFFVFFAYIAFALVGGLVLHLSVWLIVALSLPAVMLTSAALIVALVDATRRPKSQITEEARLIWVLMLCLLNVLALLPYWLVVVRRKEPTTA